MVGTIPLRTSYVKDGKDCATTTKSTGENMEYDDIDKKGGRRRKVERSSQYICVRFQVYVKTVLAGVLARTHFVSRKI
jgi:hypothetical protein